MNKILFIKHIFIFVLFSSKSFAGDTLDNYLRYQLNFFSVKPMENQNNNSNRFQYELGKQIFISPLISGNKNISCMTCHSPMKGTGDNRATSLTQDRKNILTRNSPPLFNLGQNNTNYMFHDGRVSFDPSTRIFNSPEDSFNGSNPVHKEITDVLTSALSMQVLFPMATNDEMRGNIGENEISNATSNIEVWNLITKRIIYDSVLLNLLKKSYPNISNFNIGHIAEALGQFIKEEFYSNGSPFNQYLLGNDQALTEQEKRGLDLFLDKGKCIACHQGETLGLNSFFASVGVPDIGAKPHSLDIGRGAVKGEEFKKYFFKTPSLLNLAVTGPYMHNGAFRTIRDVINHYSDIKTSLQNYKLSDDQINSSPVELEVLNDQKSIQTILNSMQAQFLKRGLNFSESEKDDLEAFLTNGLLDPKFKIYPN
jgi:cytochrome c peroxidase